MIATEVMNLFKGFLDLTDEEVREEDDAGFVLVGSGIITFYITKLTLLQGYLTPDALQFGCPYREKYAVYADGLSKGRFPVCIFLYKNKEISLESLEQAMKLAENDYVELFKNKPAMSNSLEIPYMRKNIDLKADMNLKAVMELFEGFLNLNCFVHYEDNKKYLFGGSGVITSSITKLIVLYQYLKPEALCFGIPDKEVFELFAKGLSQGRYPVFIVLYKNKEVSLESLVQAMILAKNDYVELFKNKPANENNRKNLELAEVMYLFTGFLDFNSSKVHEDNEKYVVGGLCILKDCILKLQFLQKHLKPKFFKFELLEVNINKFSKEELKNGRFPVCIFLYKNKEVSLESLEQAMILAENDYVKYIKANQPITTSLKLPSIFEIYGLPR